MRQTAGVNRGQTPRQNRKAGRTPSKPPRQNRRCERTPSALRQNRRYGRTPSALRQNHRYGRTSSANRPGRTADTDARQAQTTALAEPQKPTHIERKMPRQSRNVRRTSSAKRPSRTADTDARQAQTPRTKPQGLAHIERNHPDRAVEADTPSAEHPDIPNQPAAACPHSEFRIPPPFPRAHPRLCRR